MELRCVLTGEGRMGCAGLSSLVFCSAISKIWMILVTGYIGLFS